MTIEQKLYPPKCTKCGQFISNSDFENDRVKLKHNNRTSGALDIWHEHDYNCKEILNKYEQANKL